MDAWASNKGKTYNVLFDRAGKERILPPLLAYAEAHAPVTSRQLAYHAVTLGLIPKTEEAMKKVGEQIARLRKDGEMPFEWVADGSRQCHEPAMYHSAAVMVEASLKWLRLDCWVEKPETVVILLEKDALTGIVESVTEEYGVPLYPVRGYSSITVLHDIAQRIADDGRPAFIYQLGDRDPSGEDAARVAERDICRWADDAEITFERIAITDEQVAEMDLDRLSLAGRPTKLSDTRVRSFFARHGDGAMSIELDAIPPDELRSIVREAIERHITIAEIAALAADAEAQADAIRHQLGRTR
jgi:hypothetical protein